MGPKTLAEKVAAELCPFDQWDFGMETFDGKHYEGSEVNLIREEMENDLKAGNFE